MARRYDHDDQYPAFDDLDRQAQLSGMATQHGEKRQQQIRLGNSVRLNGLGVTNLYGRWNQIGARQRVLTINPGDAPTEGPGSWVCTLSGRVITRGPGAPGITYAMPAVAYISFGAGGVLQQVEVDAWRNVIALPAQTVFIDVAWNQYGPLAIPGDPATSPNALMYDVEFSSTAHLSQETGENIPTRSYFFSTFPGDEQFTVPIPPFATSWCVIPNVTEVTAGSLPYRVFIRGAQMSMALDHPVNEVVESMARSFCFRPLPVGATDFDLEVIGVNPASWSGQVIFRIGL